MTQLFNTVLSMSLTAGYTALGVLLVRLLLKKAPKVFSYALWAVVWFRLICPISFESMFSLIPSGIPAASQAVSAKSYLNNPVLEVVPEAGIQNQHTLTAQLSLLTPSWREVLAIAWLVGIFLLLCYSAVSYLRLKHRLAAALLVRENIYETDGIQTAFVMGFIRPKIYLPIGVSPDELDYILQHEKTHLKRLDHLIKPAAFLAVCMHWFNPLAWLCYLLMCRDMEMSCDESVVKRLGSGIKKDYSGSLLTFSERQNGLLTPLAFGETGVKARIKNILSYKKPAFWVLLLCIAAVAAVTIGFMANPKPSFELNKALSAASKFSTGETDLIKIGEQAANHYYGTFIEKDIPEQYRITQFTASNIKLMAGDSAEFCISLKAEYTTPTTQSYFISANGNFEPAADGQGGRWYDSYMEFRIKSLGGVDYEIVGVGTGGGAQGLTPVADTDEGIQQQTGTDNNQSQLTTAYLFDPNNPKYEANRSPIPLAQYTLSKEESDKLHALMGNKAEWEPLPDLEYPSLRLPQDIHLSGDITKPSYRIYGNVNGKTLIVLTESLLLSKMPAEYYAPKEVYDRIKEYLQKLTPAPNQSAAETLKQLEQRLTDLQAALNTRQVQHNNSQLKLNDIQAQQEKEPSAQNEAILTELQRGQATLKKEIQDLQAEIKKVQEEIDSIKSQKALEDINGNMRTDSRPIFTSGSSNKNMMTVQEYFRIFGDGAALPDDLDTWYK